MADEIDKQGIAVTINTLLATAGAIVSTAYGGPAAGAAVSAAGQGVNELLKKLIPGPSSNSLVLPNAPPELSVKPVRKPSPRPSAQPGERGEVAQALEALGWDDEQIGLMLAGPRHVNLEVLMRERSDGAPIPQVAGKALPVRMGNAVPKPTEPVVSGIRVGELDPNG